eukprot:4509170-Pyramimonas_sp.AAC.1
MAATVAKDCPSGLKMFSSMPPRRPQDGPETAPSGLRDPPMRSPERPTSTQDGSQTAQESPKRGPEELQDGPRSDQEHPKRAPRGDVSSSQGATIIEDFLFDRWRPGSAQDGLEGSQEGP